jgi:hypothetical protein
MCGESQIYHLAGLAKGLFDEGTGYKVIIFKPVHLPNYVVSQAKAAQDIVQGRNPACHGMGFNQYRLQKSVLPVGSFVIIKFIGSHGKTSSPSM